MWRACACRAGGSHRASLDPPYANRDFRRIIPGGSLRSVRLSADVFERIRSERLAAPRKNSRR